MKRLLSLLLAILLAFTFVSCDEPETPNFTVMFDGITYDSIVVTAGEKFKLPSDLPTQEGSVLVVKLGDTVLEAGKEYDITADTVLKCTYEPLQFKLTVDSEEPKIVDYGFEYNIDKTPREGKLLKSVKVNHEDFPGDSIIIKNDTTVVYEWVDAFTITADGRIFTVDKANPKFKIPPCKTNGHHTESVTLKGTEKVYHVGDEIDVSTDIELVYVTVPGTADLSYDGNGAVKGYSGAETAIVIPDTTPEGKVVTEIAAQAFYNNKKIESLKMPDTITKINSNAFYHCDSLKTVEWSDNLHTICDMAFSSCKALESGELPNSLVTLGESSFGGCSKLQSVKLSGNVVEIPESCFEMCSSLAKIELPDSVSKIGKAAFDGCDFTIITVPETVNEIGDFAFRCNNSLKTVVVKNGVTDLGRKAFSQCPLLENIDLPASLTNVGDDVFFKSEDVNIVVDKNKSECVGWASNWHSERPVTYKDSPKK